MHLVYLLSTYDSGTFINAGDAAANRPQISNVMELSCERQTVNKINILIQIKNGHWKNWSHKSFLQKWVASCLPSKDKYEIKDFVSYIEKHVPLP